MRRVSYKTMSRRDALKIIPLKEVLAMARRTGVPSLMKVAERLCILIVKFTPVIQHLYPSNATLLAALATANAACSALHVELAAVRDYGD
jgi:hypothetical protein